MEKINKKGFTLIEIIAAIAIIGILMLVAIPAMNKYTKSTKEKIFVDTVQKYYEVTKRAYEQDKLVCGPSKVDALSLEYPDCSYVGSLNDSRYYSVSFSSSSDHTTDFYNYNRSTHFDHTENSYPYKNYTKLIGEGEGLSPFNKDKEIYGYITFELWCQRQPGSSEIEKGINWRARFVDANGDGMKYLWLAKNLTHKSMKNSNIFYKQDLTEKDRHNAFSDHECTLED